MDKAKRDLKSASYVIIGCAILDLIGAITSVAVPGGAYTYEQLVNVSGMAPALATAGVNVTIGVAVVCFLLEIFAGLKGVIVANGGKRSRLADVIVGLAIVLTALQIVASAYAIYMGTTDFMHSRLIVQICVIVIFIYYIVLTNQVISLRKTKL